MSIPSKHTTSQESRYNVAATSRRCNDVVATLCVRWLNKSTYQLVMLFGGNKIFKWNLYRYQDITFVLRKANRSAENEKTVFTPSKHTASFRRRCDVMMSQRRHNDVITVLCNYWATFQGICEKARSKFIYKKR